MNDTGPSDGPRAKGGVLVVSAPSGAGKTTLCRRLVAEVGELEFSISHTTRPRRSEERDGADYHFVAAPEFERLKAAGEFAEWAQVGAHLYGTSAAKLREAVARGNDVLLDVDTQGAASIRRLIADAVLIFILPPSPAVLRARLLGRGSETPETLRRRLDLAAGEIARASLYDYLIVNDDLEKAYDRLRAVVLAARCARRRQEGRLLAIARQFEEEPR